MFPQIGALCVLGSHPDRFALAGCLVACQTSHVPEGIVDALAIARAEFERRLTVITADDWGRPTPCTEWNVRQLVNHIVSHEYRYADNLVTNNCEYYVASRDDDFLGDDPHGSWSRAWLFSMRQ
jgi:hypothetical protein